MKTALYWVVQCSWGILQTMLGFLLFLVHIRAPHRLYHGAVVTCWDGKSSVSLGMFVFITAEPYFYDKLKGTYKKQELSARLLVHEYGHIVQSLILGPLYLIVMGIPSTLWGFLPYYVKKRQKRCVIFFVFHRIMGQHAWRICHQRAVHATTVY